MFSCGDAAAALRRAVYPRVKTFRSDVLPQAPSPATQISTCTLLAHAHARSPAGGGAVGGCGGGLRLKGEGGRGTETGECSTYQGGLSCAGWSCGALRISKAAARVDFFIYNLLVGRGRRSGDLRDSRYCVGGWGGRVGGGGERKRRRMGKQGRSGFGFGGFGGGGENKIDLRCTATNVTRTFLEPQRRMATVYIQEVIGDIFGGSAAAAQKAGD